MLSSAYARPPWSMKRVARVTCAQSTMRVDLVSARIIFTRVEFPKILPNPIENQNNYLWAFLKSHSVLTDLLLIISVVITIILPRLKKSE